MFRPRFLCTALAAAAGLAVWPAHHGVLSAQSDLDGFMRQVMERRDDNWKKLQQYILDEREEFDLRGPGRYPIWGERREFTWFIKDGFFVRSPLKVNGAAVGEEDRRKYEDQYLRRQQARDRRERARSASGAGSSSPDAAPGPSNEVSPLPDSEPPPPTDIESFIRQTRQPEFVSSAYFLRFKFDEGRYALVGREQLDGRDVLRVEYYPVKLFNDDEDRERRRRRQQDEAGQGRPNDPRVDATVNRLMNKGSRVTLWIEPGARQIIKYTFDNVDLDFFPGQWMVNVTGAHATMTMGQPFPDVWLPQDTDISIGFMLAIGEIQAHYSLSYHDYRQADVTTAIRIPGDR
jgi:hypothetical protein